MTTIGGKRVPKPRFAPTALNDYWFAASERAISEIDANTVYEACRPFLRQATGPARRRDPERRNGASPSGETRREADA